MCDISNYSQQVRHLKLKWFGISLIAIGIGVYGAWALWVKTAINIPIDMPISMSVGHVLTPQFKVNRNRFYTIRILAKKTIPFDTLNCLLDMSPLRPSQCKQPSVIKASWTLTSDGIIVAQGVSDTDSGGAWAADYVAREIGSFRSESGRNYLLDVNLLTDGTLLSATDPHLKVEVSRDYSEGEGWMSLILIFPCASLVIIGLTFLCVSAIRSRPTN
jgi:hypothetical protein